MQFQSMKKEQIIHFLIYLYRHKTAKEMTEDIVNNQIKELKKLIDNKELHVNDIDVFCEKGKKI